MHPELNDSPLLWTGSFCSLKLEMCDLEFQQICFPSSSSSEKGSYHDQRYREASLLEHSRKILVLEAYFTDQRLVTQETWATQGVSQRADSSTQSRKDRTCAWPVSHQLCLAYGTYSGMLEHYQYQSLGRPKASSLKSVRCNRSVRRTFKEMSGLGHSSVVKLSRLRVPSPALKNNKIH